MNFRLEGGQEVSYVLSDSMEIPERVEARHDNHKTGVLCCSRGTEVCLVSLASAYAFPGLPYMGMGGDSPQSQTDSHLWGGDSRYGSFFHCVCVCFPLWVGNVVC